MIFLAGALFCLSIRASGEFSGKGIGVSGANWGRGLFAGKVAGLSEVLAGFPLMVLGGGELPLGGLADMDVDVPVTAPGGPPRGGDVALPAGATDVLGEAPAGGGGVGTAIEAVGVS
jgi:hypothetical protein